MYWMPLLLTVAAAVTVTYAAVGATCSNNVQCGQGECCQILSEYMIMSKKRQLDWMTTTPPYPTRGTLGSCQRYQLEGSSCNPFDKINGYCSCEPGTRCVQHEYPITSTTEPTTEGPTSTTPHLAKRTFGRPGYVWFAKCEK
ncbi:unnamed protein product [Lymnaea stagnalis]|uniref:Prokineticin domain-containing protein n=1 Tax=Lymnaea stagnalis TaxID=6523 RepID=A0AAV2I9P1_LYMST